EFKTVSDVESCLQFLIDKYPPIVARLALAPGTKEPRYGQLLGGDAALAQQESAFGTASASPSAQGSRVGKLEQEVAALRGEVEALKQQFEEFKKQFD
ncbi:MAG: DUF480 domain-containing protein, partial [Telluria sp.]